MGALLSPEFRSQGATCLSWQYKTFVTSKNAQRRNPEIFLGASRSLPMSTWVSAFYKIAKTFCTYAVYAYVIFIYMHMHTHTVCICVYENSYKSRGAGVVSTAPCVERKLCISRSVHIQMYYTRWYTRIEYQRRSKYKRKKIRTS